ncbi:uncharacterized protein LOC113204347 [Frankliniella occidentalis]|uniref:Uncharacterized protein LOC113204347 n=1 Tax=Frankliniella occidentalis TaxID=133901 RepID=A0A6J1S9B7_FRAOC|nr:uncharacterized protein LOC113204347 [Frankliniella occidentalis]
MTEPTLAQVKRELEAIKKELHASEEARTAIEKSLIASDAAKAALEAAVGNSAKSVSGKLPAFWADKPSVWFAQAESHFTNFNILQDAKKYHYVVSQLDTATAAEVEDIITGPMGDRTYKNLKDNLISRLSDSEQKRVQKLISDEVMGDRKPSQFLRHLRSLAGSSAAVSDALLSQIWLQRLPATASAILSSHSNLDLNALATMADKIVEVAPAIPSAVLAIKTNPPPPSPDVSVLIFETLQKLPQQIASLVSPRERRDDRQSRSRSQSRFRDNRSASRSRDLSRSAPHSSRGGDSSMCWYHARHGSNAQKCVSPCSFNQGNAPGNQQ